MFDATTEPGSSPKRIPFQMRIGPKLFADIKEQAAARESTITRELERLLDLGLMMDRIAGDRSRVLNELFAAWLSETGGAASVLRVLERHTPWGVLSAEMQRLAMNHEAEYRVRGSAEAAR
jgi:hypothetical protein